MDRMDLIKGKSYLVFGLGRSGLSLCKALARAGVDCIASDDDPAHFAALPKTVKGVAVDRIDWSKHYDALILSPGIPHHLPHPHPVAEQANALGIPILCDVDLLCRISEKPRRIVITGTNGKSTTTALIGHILQGHFDYVEIGGNIGKPVFDFKKKADVQVIEASSYQLERSPHLVCDVAVWLNISPDHLDRHGDMDGYIAAKHKVFNQSCGSAMAVIGIDDGDSRTVAEQIEKDEQWHCLPVSGKTLPKKGYGVKDGRLCFIKDDEVSDCLDLRSLSRLRGDHNHQNLAAAWAACSALGVPNTVIADQVATFQGLPHRQFLSCTINGVAYINDSKATNAQAAYWALKAYDSIHWIAGGVAKDGGLEGLESVMGHVRKAYLIGEAAAEFAKWLDNHGVECERCETLDRAVAMAHDNAQEDRGLPGKSPVVLLSPACASFDQYPDFEKRGEAFEALIAKLDDGS